MRYTVYWDLFFGRNLCINLWIILVTGRILGQKMRWGRGVAAGAFGAAFACFTLTGWIPHVLETLLALGPVSMGMVRIALFSSSRKEFFLHLAGFYGVSFLLGGFLSVFLSGKGSLPFSLVFSLIVLMGVLMMEGARWLQSRRIHGLCQVQLIWKGQSLHLVGLVDTGNSLRTPGGRPVHVVSAAALRLWQNQPMEQLLWIPYRSVGEKEGVLPAICIDELRWEKGTVIQNPVIALSKYPVSHDDRYQILLHPQEVLT